LCCLVLRGERVGDVQIWPNRDHIAITTGDASTTRRKRFLDRDARLLHRLLSLKVSLAILIVASRQIRK
jgi:hypothetical protein